MKEAHRLSTDWLKDLKTKEERDSRTKTIYNHTSDEVLMVLKRLLRQRQEALRNNTFDYTVSSWSHLQAHNNGERQAIAWIEDLLSFVKD